MHAVVIESLEEYLSGRLEPAACRRVELHLRDCPRCRAGVDAMANASRLFASLCSEACDPAPGFYARVVYRIEAAPSIAGFFAFDLVFMRRMAFSCMLLLVAMGGFLVSREVAYHGGFSPAAILSQDNAAASDTALAQDNMLLTLTAYAR
jgi:hypothetical protein